MKLMKELQHTLQSTPKFTSRAVQKCLFTSKLLATTVLFFYLHKDKCTCSSIAGVACFFWANHDSQCSKHNQGYAWLPPVLMSSYWEDMTEQLILKFLFRHSSITFSDLINNARQWLVFRKLTMREASGCIIKSTLCVCDHAHAWATTLCGITPFPSVPGPGTLHSAWACWVHTSRSTGKLCQQRQKNKWNSMSMKKRNKFKILNKKKSFIRQTYIYVKPQRWM